MNEWTRIWYDPRRGYFKGTLPESKKVEVLVIRNGKTRSDIFYKNPFTGGTFAHSNPREVTAWMLMPEPYEGWCDI